MGQLFIFAGVIITAVGIGTIIYGLVWFPKAAGTASGKLVENIQPAPPTAPSDAMPPSGPVPSVPSQSPRGPTLEATGHSKIDVTGGTIPGDLPFQFGVARDHSAILAPGITVTPTDNGYRISSVPVDRNFPPPAGEFSPLDNHQLETRMLEMARSLRDLQTRIDARMQQFFSMHPNIPLPNGENVKERQALREEFRTYWLPFTEEYESKYQNTALELASEAMNRIGRLVPEGSSIKLGAGLLLNKAFAGPSPAKSIADFLDYVSEYLH